MSMVDHCVSDNCKIICPYCRAVLCHGNDLEMEDGDEMEEECDKCGKKFVVTMAVTVDYTMMKSCTLNNKEHEYARIESQPEYEECVKCGNFRLQEKK